MHDEGTGGNADGGYGMFSLFPLTGCDFTSCPVDINVRNITRAPGKDGARGEVLLGSTLTSVVMMHRCVSWLLHYYLGQQYQVGDYLDSPSWTDQIHIP